MIWAFTGSAITKIAAAVGGYFLLHGALNNQNTWVAGFSAYTPSHASVISYGSSLASLENSASMKNTGVMLDLERWPFTPVTEQQHPAQDYASLYKYIQYSDIGHFLVAAPAFNLVKTIEPNYTGKLYPEFLRLNLAGKIAPYVGAYIIQAQGAERNPAEYARLVDNIAHQVRMVSPSTLILAALSTNPSGASVPESTLVQDIRAVKYTVNGYWISIPSKGVACPDCAAPDPLKAVHLLTDSIMGG